MNSGSFSGLKRYTLLILKQTIIRLIQVYFLSDYSHDLSLDMLEYAMCVRVICCVLRISRIRTQTVKPALQKQAASY